MSAFFFSEASGPLSALLLPYFVCSPLWNSPFSADPALSCLDASARSRHKSMTGCLNWRHVFPWVIACWRPSLVFGFVPSQNQCAADMNL